MDLIRADLIGARPPAPGSPGRGPRPSRAPAFRALLAAVAALVALAVPVECPGCCAPDVALCSACRRLLRAPALPVTAAVPAPVWACAAYTGQVSRCVVAWKDRGRQDLTRPLGAALARAVDAAVADGCRVAPGPVVLVPVPSSAAACRVRGADVTARLARSAARELRRRGIRAEVRHVLRQRRGVSDQAGLGAAVRRANVDGAFGLRRGMRFRRRVPVGRPVVVVDDVVTTGASAAEACRVIRRQGGAVLAVAAACWTPRRRPPDSGVARADAGRRAALAWLEPRRAVGAAMESIGTSAEVQQWIS